MTDQILKAIGNSYSLKEKNAPAEVSDFTVNGMNFRACAYDARNLGSVSVMTASLPTGQTAMETLVVNPFDVDAPLMSVDIVLMGGKTMLLTEFYDTTLGHAFPMGKIRAAMSPMPADPDPATHWYDHLGLFTWRKMLEGNDVETAQKLLLDCIDAYLKETAKAPGCDANRKRKIASDYTEGLLNQGGPATDMVKAGIGHEKAAVLLREVLFGTGNPE